MWVHPCCWCGLQRELCSISGVRNLWFLLNVSIYQTRLTSIFFISCILERISYARYLKGKFLIVVSFALNLNGLTFWIKGCLILLAKCSCVSSRGAELNSLDYNSKEMSAAYFPFLLGHVLFQSLFFAHSQLSVSVIFSSTNCVYNLDNSTPEFVILFLTKKIDKKGSSPISRT